MIHKVWTTLGMVGRRVAHEYAVVVTYLRRVMPDGYLILRLAAAVYFVVSLPSAGATGLAYMALAFACMAWSDAIFARRATRRLRKDVLEILGEVTEAFDGWAEAERWPPGAPTHTTLDAMRHATDRRQRERRAP